MKYFKLSEFECPCCGVAQMDELLLRKLDLLRSVFGLPLTVNSGFRCARHNASLKDSSPNSQHLLGKAVDIGTGMFSGQDRYKLASLAFEHGFKGIGIGKNFIHLDIREGNLSFWGY